MGEPSESPSSYNWETSIQAHLPFPPNTQHGCDAGSGLTKPSISAPSCPSLSSVLRPEEVQAHRVAAIQLSIFFLLKKKKKFYLFICLAVSGCSRGILRDLVPELGLEPRPLALGGRSLTHWTTLFSCCPAPKPSDAEDLSWRSLFHPKSVSA